MIQSVSFLEKLIFRIGDSGKVKAEIEWLGEGWDGDYNPDNPDDVPFLRFSVYKRDDDGHWESIDDSSYCTLLPAGTHMNILMDALEYIMDHVEEAVCDGRPIKKICEQLSWMEPSWFLPKMKDEEDIA